MRLAWLVVLGSLLSLQSFPLEAQQLARAKTKGQVANREASGLVRQLKHEIEKFLGGGETQIIELAVMIAVREQTGWTIRSKNALRILSVENGSATVKGRKLPAAIVTAELMLVNKAEATYGAEKLYYAAANDSEFELWRAPLFSYGDDMDKKLDEWRIDVGFRPGSASGRRGSVRRTPAADEPAPGTPAGEEGSR